MALEWRFVLATSLSESYTAGEIEGGCCDCCSCGGGGGGGGGIGKY